MAGQPYLRVIIDREAVARDGLNPSPVLDVVVALGSPIEPPDCPAEQALRIAIGRLYSRSRKVAYGFGLVARRAVDRHILVGQHRRGRK